MLEKDHSTNLLLKLLHHGLVNSEGVLLGRDLHGSVIDGTNSSGQVGDSPGRQLPLLGDRSCQLSGVVLDVLDMSLDLGSELLEVLDDGRLDSPSERSVGIGNETSLVSDSVEDILHTAFTEELISGPERDLDDSTKLRELLGSIGLNIGDTLKVGYENI